MPNFISMKRSLFIIALLLVSLTVWSQNDKGQINQKDGINYTVKGINDTVYAIAEREPSYPDGLVQFQNYILAHFNKSVLKVHQGPMKEIVIFIVEKDGSLTNVKVIKGVTAAIDSETVRVIRTSPKWLPGINNMKVRNVQFAASIKLN